jgi:hypothetical protein
LLIFLNLVFKLLSIFAFVALATAQRNPNPCEGVADGGWANDWATCGSYFWCGPSNTIRTSSCREGFGFDQTAQECNTAANTCDACPATGFIGVAASATTCTDFTFCSEGARWADVQTCPTGLLFDRVTGDCALPENVSCPAGGGDPPVSSGDCPPPPDISSIEVTNDCTKFVVS